MTVHRDGWFQIELPPDWKQEEGAEALSIFDPNGAGAITASMFWHANGTEGSTLALATRFAVQRGAAPEQICVLASEPGRSVVELTDGAYWKIAAFCRPGQAVLMSYNSDLNDRDREAEAVERILASFRWDERS